ncbi:hypothetical protein A2311_06450 [candidate division WOR-1 bacterium RIFOXYB2_FULL_48_7]|uniref:Glucose-6-phosphate isomerase n=1 Tax=candidate division WOR-1 bacterium RIFOXYB2_FULL_48_7 TaxID=1802583 RepID=A0A1F4T835_UNCSA|nr:MAG: hypothetical protein A2311_06450 [candidate division WOR-1 bacterium RIFOXYB2_FULL_48_7]HII17450.1 hypothetical protein [Candidatus Woesearchaeota archaeon]HII68770.1 hypothetical protein [Candidatus Woesearchaeota archaeon]
MSKEIVVDISYSLEGTVIANPINGEEHRLGRLHAVMPQEISDVVNTIRSNHALHAGLKEAIEKRGERGHGLATTYGVLNAPFDYELGIEAKNISRAIREKGIEPRHIILAGIGGSELGATAAISAAGKQSVNYYPVTSLNNDAIVGIKQAVNPRESVLLMVSRSGTTKESTTAFEVMHSYFAEHLPKTELPSHIIQILGEDGIHAAKKKGYHTLPIVGSMSGRYTALHAANLLTMELAGVDIDGLTEGARAMYQRCFSVTATRSNPALEIAAVKYILTRQREEQYAKNIWVTSVFSPKLYKYGEWLDQLTEESLGHREDIFLTTKTAEFSNKAHSDFQNWIGGANRYLHQFVVPLESEYADILSGSNPENPAETVNDIEKAAYFGIAQSLALKDRPSFTTVTPAIDAYCMGQLMMRDMIATVYLGEVLGLHREEKTDGIGYFNQPGVQHYKGIMNHLLGNPSALRRYVSVLGSRIEAQK